MVALLLCFLSSYDGMIGLLSDVTTFDLNIFFFTNRHDSFIALAVKNTYGTSDIEQKDMAHFNEQKL